MLYNCITDLVYLIFIQHCYMFRLLISAVIYEYWFTERVKWKMSVLAHSGCKIIEVVFVSTIPKME